MPGREFWVKFVRLRRSSHPSFGDDYSIPTEADEPGQLQRGFEFQLQPTTVLAVNYIHNKLIRTIEDVGRLVEGSEVYTYGNPGEGILKNALLSTATTPFNIPKPKRQYDALQVSLNRRFAGNWFVGGNYTLSRLYGNYAGSQTPMKSALPGTAHSASISNRARRRFWQAGTRIVGSISTK